MPARLARTVLLTHPGRIILAPQFYLWREFFVESYNTRQQPMNGRPTIDL
jgi:hypothetical protein